MIGNPGGPGGRPRNNITHFIPWAKSSIVHTKITSSSNIVVKFLNRMKIVNLTYVIELAFLAMANIRHFCGTFIFPIKRK